MMIEDELVRNCRKVSSVRFLERWDETAVMKWVNVRRHEPGNTDSLGRIGSYQYLHMLVFHNVKESDESLALLHVIPDDRVSERPQRSGSCWRKGSIVQISCRHIFWVRDQPRVRVSRSVCRSSKLGPI